MSTFTTPHATTGTMSFFLKGWSTLLCSALFCKTISTASLVRSSMDCFIKVVSEKKNADDDTIHGELIAKVRVYLNAGRNVLLCGPHGVGKSYVIDRVVDHTNGIFIETEHLRPKSIFLDCIKESPKHCVFDDITSEARFKTMIERVSEGHRLTKGSVIATSTELHLLSNFETIYMGRHAPETLLLLRPNASWAHAVAANGSVQNFLSYVDIASDAKDLFPSGKDVITELLTVKSNRYGSEKAFEHGNMFAMFQENYLDSVGVDYARSALSFSDADVFDSALYEGDWDCMGYFINAAFHLPKWCMGEPLHAQNIRAGSSWTKYGNYKMRRQKVRQISDAAAPYGLDVQSLCLLRRHAEKKNFDILQTYNITPQAFDIMNHLCLSNNKLKQREVSNIKKQLKAHYVSDG